MLIYTPSVEKLLEHLHKWTEPQKPTSPKIWKEGEEIKIASHIINIFHLLPSAASKLLGTSGILFLLFLNFSNETEPLVSLTIQLEAILPRAISSP